MFVSYYYWFILFSMVSVCINIYIYIYTVKRSIRVCYWSTTSGAVETFVFTACEAETIVVPQLVPLCIRTTPLVELRFCLPAALHVHLIEMAKRILTSALQSRAQGPVGTPPPTLTGVFLWSGHLPALVVRMLLMRAGDVEVNPGPGLFCKPCGRTLRTNQPHLRCGSCIATSHKQEKCSGLRRVSQTPGNWTCSDCVPPVPVRLPYHRPYPHWLDNR